MRKAHSKAPWKIVTYVGGISKYIVDSAGVNVARVTEVIEDPHESQSNANLIAMAPDMLNELEMILEGNCYLNKIEEIVNKAKGIK